MYRISSNKRLGAYSKIDFGRMAFGELGEALNQGALIPTLIGETLRIFKKQQGF